jgi:hypothetical protein
MSTLQDYYHLTKETFSIDPWDDADIYFGDQELERRIRRRLEADFVQQRGVPKFFVSGRYGAGKTHTLAHIRHVLVSDPGLTRDFPTEPIYFEISPIRSKESWATIHERLINAIGLGRLKEAMTGTISGGGAAEDPIQALEAKGVLRYGEEAIRTSQAQIFRNLLFGGRQETLSWEWLKGRALKVDEAQMLRTETNLAAPPDYIACLLNVASLIHKGLGRKIVFLIDEGEAVGNLVNADSFDEFVFAFRRLVDPENNALGVIVAYESEGGGMEAAPRLFQHPAIVRRVDYAQGFFDLSTLLPTETRAAQEFIVQVLGHLVDQDRAREIVQREGLETEPEYFPFTKEAVDAIADFVTQDPERTLPSQIIALLSNAVVEAWRRRDETMPDAIHVLVDEEIANIVMYPEEL